LQGPPPGPGQAAQGGGRIPWAGGGGHYPPFRFAVVFAAAHGTQEGRVMAALRRLPPAQPVFLLSKLFYKEKVKKFPQIYGKMWMKKMLNEGNQKHKFVVE
jgi:hypothetical protein